MLTEKLSAYREGALDTIRDFKGAMHSSSLALKAKLSESEMKIVDELIGSFCAFLEEYEKIYAEKTND